ncbi:hypothetical protein ACLOJK_018500 [Asimina triloba]
MVVPVFGELLLVIGTSGRARCERSGRCDGCSRRRRCCEVAGAGYTGSLMTSVRTELRADGGRMERTDCCRTVVTNRAWRWAQRSTDADGANVFRRRLTDAAGADGTDRTRLLVVDAARKMQTRWKLRRSEGRCSCWWVPDDGRRTEVQPDWGRRIRRTDAGRRWTIQALSIGAALLAVINANPPAVDEDDELMQRQGHELMASETMAIMAASAAAAGGPLLQKRDQVADGISDD